MSKCTLNDSQQETTLMGCFLHVDIGEDVVILLLPMPVIQTLQMPRGQKQGLIIMLLLGARYVLLSSRKVNAHTVPQRNCNIDYPTLYAR